MTRYDLALRRPMPACFLLRGTKAFGMKIMLKRSSYYVSPETQVNVHCK